MTYQKHLTLTKVSQLFPLIILLALFTQNCLQAQWLFTPSHTITSKQMSFVELQKERSKLSQQFVFRFSKKQYQQLYYSDLHVIKTYHSGTFDKSYLLKGNEVVSTSFTSSNPMNVGRTNKVIDSMNPYGAQSVGESLSFVAADFLIKHIFKK